VVFKKAGKEKVAMNELQNVRVYAPGANQEFFIVDFNIRMNCADDRSNFLNTGMQALDGGQQKSGTIKTAWF
jgi:hypothetical protein